MPRNRYINEAIQNYNQIQSQKLLVNRLNIESDLVKKDSISVLKDLEEIDRLPSSI